MGVAKSLTGCFPLATITSVVFSSLCILPACLWAAKLHETKMGDIVRIKCHEYTIVERLGWGAGGSVLFIIFSWYLSSHFKIYLANARLLDDPCDQEAPKEKHKEKQPVRFILLIITTKFLFQ
jgi:hypothetical protein